MPFVPFAHGQPFPYKLAVSRPGLHPPRRLAGRATIAPMFDDGLPLSSACATADGSGEIALRVLRSAAGAALPVCGSTWTARRGWSSRAGVRERRRCVFSPAARTGCSGGMANGWPSAVRGRRGATERSCFFRGETGAAAGGGRSPRCESLLSPDEVLRGVAPAEDYRTAIQSHLRALAERELPGRTRELAQDHGIAIRRVTIRAQKTRWGSCSSRGTISLNWKLIQAPPLVRDYLMIHELMHCRQMNHSARYWKLVAEAFPRWQEAEAWLKRVRLENL